MSRKGYHLLPLKPGDKIPYFDLLPGNSTDIFKENQAKSSLVESWIKQDPQVNLGVFAGTEITKNYRLVIVDFDKEMNFGLPITPMVKTKRGYHAYFKCRTDRLPEAHKTPRGEIKTSGYVVAPPSKHPSGMVYKWADYLSFIDVGLAEFHQRSEQIISFLEGTNSDRFYYNQRDEDKLNTTININSSVKNRDPLSISKDIKENRKKLEQLSRSEEVALSVMREVFEIEVGRVGRTFNCPLHEEENPSAALYKTDNGVIGMKDFHRSGAFYTLPQLYYEYKTGNDNRLRGASSLIWWIRLLKEVGFVEPPRIMPPKPLEKLSKNQKILYKAFINLLELQQVYDPNQKAAPFSHRFAASWSGLKYESVRSAKRGLSKKKYIKKVEPGDRKTRKAGKWALVRD